MKAYSELSKQEIDNIVLKGGEELAILNEMVAEYLKSLGLTEESRRVIHGTHIHNMATIFGGLMTAEEVELFITSLDDSDIEFIDDTDDY